MKRLKAIASIVLLALLSGLAAWILRSPPDPFVNWSVPAHSPSGEVVTGDHPGGPGRNSASGDMVNDAEAATADRLAQSEALAQEIGALAEAQIPGRLENLSPQDLQGEPGRLLIRRWAELNAEAAADWVRHLQGPLAMQSLAEALALAWADRDITGALAWARTLELASVREQALAGLSSELARTDPVGSMQLLASLPQSPTRDGALLHSLRQWAETDAEAARNWAMQLSPGPLRQEAMAAVSAVMASGDADVAARLAVSELEPGPAQDRAVVSILQQWVQQDPPGAVDWATQFPAGHLQTAALDNLVRIWAATDPEPVGLWLNTLPDGTVRDQASASFSAWLSPWFPEQAGEWAGAIADPPLRTRELDRIAREKRVTFLNAPMPAASAE